MKPDTRTAMQQLIEQARSAMPFGAPEAFLCSGICHGCSLKLLDYLDMALEDWECRLGQGEKPNFGDLDKLAKTSKKIYKALQRNGLIES